MAPLVERGQGARPSFLGSNMKSGFGQASCGPLGVHVPREHDVAELGSTPFRSPCTRYYGNLAQQGRDAGVLSSSMKAESRTWLECSLSAARRDRVGPVTSWLLAGCKRA